MASLTYESKARRGWRLHVCAGTDWRRRHSIRLGDISQREANIVRRHVEAIAQSQKDRTPMPIETTRWLEKLPGPLRRKLSPLLGAARSVREAADAYLEHHADTNKPSTHRAYAGTLDQFCRHCGNQQMRSLSAADIDAWLDRINSSPNTVAKHAKHLRAFFAWARSQCWLDDLQIRTSGTIGVGDKRFLTDDEILAWADRFRRQPQLRAAILIARWTGCRVPSELLTMTVGSVDWETSRFTVIDAKRSHRQSRGPPRVRVLPLFPELAEVLTGIWRSGQPPHAPLLPDVLQIGGDSFVLRCRDALAETGIQWPRLFTSVRATRETELIRRFGLKAACEWIGNSPAVALRNYEQITAETWAEATSPLSPNQTQSTVENALPNQHGGAAKGAVKPHPPTR